MKRERVSTHITKLISLWNVLNNGLRAKNEDVLPHLLLLCKTLQILPCKFENVASIWMLLSKDEEKCFDELTTQLCMYERKLTKRADTKRKNAKNARTFVTLQ